MKYLIAVLALTLSGCASFEYPMNCVGHVQSANYTAPIYDIRTVGKNIEYKAGGPFQLAWVPESTFSKITCSK